MSKKKKILIIPSWYPYIDSPLNGIFFKEQAKLMSEDFDVKVFVGKDKKSNFFLKLLYSFVFVLFRIPVLKKLENYFISDPFVYAFSYQKLFVRNYNHRVISYLKYFDLNIYPNWKPDLIHAHDTMPGGICARALSEKYEIPYLITEHNYLMFDRYNKSIRNKFIGTLNNAETVMLVSEYQKRILALRKIGKKLIVTGNYVDDNLYDLPDTQKQEKFKILFVGRKAHHKDFDTLKKCIKTFASIAGTGNYVFQLIGFQPGDDTGFSNDLKELIDTGHVDVLGNIGRNEIISYFKSCSVLLATSIAETFGVAVCEAIMCGKPVVSTNNGGFDEMFVPGINGNKCPIGNFKCLAQALLDIYQKRVKFNPVAIRESVLNKFGKNAFKHKIGATYNNTMENYEK